ncbi:hypothetical protein [Salinactinospora qingdaonensis]|uniref:Uncharacterized protein n=1 Tax=Salinactinospora qingdaonensis TaxID=702744 RepID=A0ABP7EZK5_9ACTN
MATEPLACTIDPSLVPAQQEGFRALLAAARTTERVSPQHLRLMLATDNGLDISPLVQEKQCCRFFDFTLTPTVEGTVMLDIRVPASAGPVNGPALRGHEVGTPEEILDWFAATAVEPSRANG